jgi:hypothetical protein
VVKVRESRPRDGFIRRKRDAIRAKGRAVSDDAVLEQVEADSGRVRRQVVDPGCLIRRLTLRGLCVGRPRRSKPASPSLFLIADRRTARLAFTLLARLRLGHHPGPAALDEFSLRAGELSK